MSDIWPLLTADPLDGERLLTKQLRLRAGARLVDRASYEAASAEIVDLCGTCGGSAHPMLPVTPDSHGSRCLALRVDDALTAATPTANSTPPADTMMIMSKPKGGMAGFARKFTEGLIMMQQIAIHGPRLRPDARDYELLGDAAEVMVR